ncbi:MAG: VOC family protein, partial [Planktomarina sp.]|nr:VOC family protein [Planktomarina sp.]
DQIFRTFAEIAYTLVFYNNILGMQALEFIATHGSLRWALKFGVKKLICIRLTRFLRPILPLPAYVLLICFFCRQPFLDDWHNHLAAHGVDVIDCPVARSGRQGLIM